MLPHFEEAGWQLLVPMELLWPAAAEGADLSKAADAAVARIDANSSQIVRRVLALAAAACAPGQIDELQLAVTPNPLAGRRQVGVAVHA